MRSVLLWAPEIGGTLFAERGRISADPDGAFSVTLERGSLLLPSKTQAREIRFETMTTRLPATDPTVARKGSDELAGVRLGDLVALARSGPDSGQRAQRARVELQRRVALPAATILFGLLALPIALRLRSFSRSAGGMAGILVAIAYYGLVQLGDGLIAGQSVSVPLGVWLPNLAVGLLGTFLYVGVNRRASFGHTNKHRREFPRWRLAWMRKPLPDRHQARPYRMRPYALQRYVASRFIELAFAAFALLVVGYLLVDMLERLEFFARYATTAANLARYYTARIPLLASRIVPMALLLATALTASLFASQNELQGMRSCGLAPARVLSTILWLCAGVAPVAFVLGDQVVPRTESIAYQVKQVAIRGSGSEPAASPAWYRVGERVYEAEILDRLMGTARNLRIYEIGPDALPVVLTEAKEANYVGNGVWKLFDASRMEVGDGTVRRTLAPTLVELVGEPPADVSTIRMSAGELRELIREASDAGLDTTPFRVDLYAKLAAPLACVVLPALALLFATGGPPYPNPALTLLAAFALAVAYQLLTGIGTSLGYGCYLPPAVAGAAPVALLALLTMYLSSRVPDLRR